MRGRAPSELPVALVKGGGDLATGVCLRLHRAGFGVVVTETERPTAIRRRVAFAEAVYEGRVCVEDVRGAKAQDLDEIQELLRSGQVPVLVDSRAVILRALRPILLVDAILAKRNLGTRIGDAPAVVALGPGFTAGKDAHAVVETKRGHTLGRVIWSGPAMPNTGIPGELHGYSQERIIRSPAAGIFRGTREIGEVVDSGEVVGWVDRAAVRAGLHGVLRGILHSGLEVTPGFKLGDVDPKASPEECCLVSDKALAVAGGALEAACHLLGGVCFANVSIGPREVEQ